MDQLIQRLEAVGVVNRWSDSELPALMFQAHYGLGLSYRHIGHLTSVPKDTVRRMISRHCWREYGTRAPTEGVIQAMRRSSSGSTERQSDEQG